MHFCHITLSIMLKISEPFRDHCSTARRLISREFSPTVCFLYHLLSIYTNPQHFEETSKRVTGHQKGHLYAKIFVYDIGKKSQAQIGERIDLRRMVGKFNQGDSLYYTEIILSCLTGAEEGGFNQDSLKSKLKQSVLCTPYRISILLFTLTRRFSLLFE